jgi:hypothetical protein
VAKRIGRPQDGHRDRTPNDAWYSVWSFQLRLKNKAAGEVLTARPAMRVPRPLTYQDITPALGLRADGDDSILSQAG